MGNLKQLIEDAKREHLKKREAEEVAARHRRNKIIAERRNVTKTIVLEIPGRVRAALEKGELSVQVYADSTVQPVLENNSDDDVVGMLISLLTEEGLADKLWIDVDVSGGYTQTNRLMMTI